MIVFSKIKSALTKRDRKAPEFISDYDRPLILSVWGLGLFLKLYLSHPLPHA